MDSFKAKMAETAEKAKAAYAMRKEEIAAAIEADMALLQAAEVAAEYVEKYGEAEEPAAEETEAE